MSEQDKKRISLVLRIGLAFAFLYPPISAFLDPNSWIGYFPQFMRNITPSDAFLLNSFGIFEIVIAFWILWGKKILYPLYTAIILLLSIVIFNWNQLDVLFRDLSMIAIAVALIYLHRKSKVSSE